MIALATPMKDPHQRNNKKEVIEAWIKLQNTPQESKSHKELFWSHVVLQELIRDQPQKAWELIVEILRTDASDKILENLSAGPLEDLLVYHGGSVIDEVEAEASRNPMLRKLLGGVWRRSMGDDVWKRLLRYADRNGWNGLAR